MAIAFAPDQVLSYAIIAQNPPITVTNNTWTFIISSCSGAVRAVDPTQL